VLVLYTLHDSQGSNADALLDSFVSDNQAAINTLLAGARRAK
jgi:hypothetical protein